MIIEKDTDQMNISYESSDSAETELIPLSVPEIRGNEWRYVKDCLDSGWISSVGSYVNKFEVMFSKQLGINFSVATVNGTSALHIAILVAGVKPDDEVLVSTLTFIAPVNAIRYSGAWPVFIDAEPNYWQMDSTDLELFLRENCEKRSSGTFNIKTGHRVHAIIPVHILGHPCEMDHILRLAHDYHLAVIEDATESLGALYKNKNIGSIGDIACFSFNGNKVISNGGGGMIVTNNEEWARKARYLSTQAKDDPLEFIHAEIGFNYRMTNVLAAIGVAQLEQLDEFIKIKREIAKRYENGLAGIAGITLMPEAAHVFSTKWLNTILVNEDIFRVNSRDLIRILNKNSIEARPLWQPIHQSPAYSNLRPRQCPNAERINRLAVSIPSSVGLTLQQQEKVITTIKNANKYGL